MRPGKVNENRSEYVSDPLIETFFDNFALSDRGRNHTNNCIDCCLIDLKNGNCFTHNWIRGGRHSKETFNNWDLNLETFGRGDIETWDGYEPMPGDEVGMLLDLDEGTLTIYKDGKKLGVKYGLAGEYCWVASMHVCTQVTIERGTIHQAEEEDGAEEENAVDSMSM